MFPVSVHYFIVLYSEVLFVTRTSGGLLGCDYSAAYNAPLCQEGDVLFVGFAGGVWANAQAVTLIGPASLNSYDCGSLYVNQSRGLGCTVPQVDAADRGEVLSVTVTVSGPSQRAVRAGAGTAASVEQSQRGERGRSGWKAVGVVASAEVADYAVCWPCTE